MDVLPNLKINFSEYMRDGNNFVQQGLGQPALRQEQHRRPTDPASPHRPSGATRDAPGRAAKRRSMPSRRRSVDTVNVPEASVAPCCESVGSTAAADCLLSRLRADGLLSTQCAHNLTVAHNTITVACMRSTTATARGLLLVSRTSDGAPACTTGDVYRAEVSEVSDLTLFTSLSRSVSPTAPSVYWINMSAASLPGLHSYRMHIELLETQPRDLQLKEGRGPLRWSVHDSSPLTHWLRDRRDVCESVPLPFAEVQMRGFPPVREPLCAAVPRDATYAYYAVEPNASCGPSRCSFHIAKSGSIVFSIVFTFARSWYEKPTLVSTGLPPTYTW